MHLIKSFLVFLLQREGFSRFNKIYEYDYRLLNQNCAMVMTSVSGHLLGLEFVGQYRKWFVFSQSQATGCQQHFLLATTGPSLKNVCLALPTQGFTWWVGRSAYFLFLNIYYFHMDRNGKKIKNLRFGKNFLE